MASNCKININMIIPDHENPLDTLKVPITSFFKLFQQQQQQQQFQASIDLQASPQVKTKSTSAVYSIPNKLNIVNKVSLC